MSGNGRGIDSGIYGGTRGVLFMITEDQAIRWLWDQYKAARTMTEIEVWFDLFALNQQQQRKAAGVA